MFCPSCGGEIPADQRFARMTVCEYCESAVILDEKAARVAGKMAVLAQTPSDLFVGATGKLQDRHFTVLGRVRYGYAKGYWDEWYVKFLDDSTAWISEDENNFSLESHREEDTPPIHYAEVRPGDEVQIGDTLFHIDEKDVAECEGGEGQLPFPILSGEKVPFLELSRGQRFATIEFDLEDETARVFHGRRLSADEIRVDVTAQEAGASSNLVSERAGSEDRRERIVRRDDRSKDIKCYSCGGPLELPDPMPPRFECGYCGSDLDLTLRKITCPNCSATIPAHGGKEAKSVSCKHCDSFIDVSKPEPSLLGQLFTDRRPPCPFDLGQKCTFDGVDYFVVGRIRFVSRDAWGVYPSDELMLYSEDRGYQWLTYENGHYSLSVEMDDRPMGFNPRTAYPKERLHYDGKSWQVYERADFTIDWVEGELPWVAKWGDQSHYMDAINPPYLLSAEWTDTELEWYSSKYLTRKEVAEAFSVDETSLPPAIGVAPHQPYPNKVARTQSAIVFVLAAIVFGTAGLVALLHKGEHLKRIEVAAEGYAQPYLTSPFEVTKSNALCKAQFSAPVSNSWVYLEVAAINDKEEALLDFSAEMSYYHGVEGGERWSEGSKKDSAVFKLKEPGTYRLLLQGQAGRSNKSDSGTTARYGKTVTIDIYQGAVIARYFLIIAALSLVYPLFEFFRRSSFEKERWGEDDDDDDD